MRGNSTRVLIEETLLWDFGLGFGVAKWRIQVYPLPCVRRPQQATRGNVHCPQRTMNAAKKRRRAVRKTFHHGDLRKALLEAGMALAREGGPNAIVLREATRRAGVAPNAAYRHFSSPSRLLK